MTADGDDEAAPPYVGDAPPEEKAQMREHFRAGRVRLPDETRALMDALGLSEEEVLAHLARALGEEQ